jgi:ribosomal protein S27E
VRIGRRPPHRRYAQTGPAASRLELQGKALIASCGTCGQNSLLLPALAGGARCSVCGEALFQPGVAGCLRSALKAGGVESMVGWAQRMGLWRG